MFTVLEQSLFLLANKINHKQLTKLNIYLITNEQLFFIVKYVK